MCDSARDADDMQDATPSSPIHLSLLPPGPSLGPARMLTAHSCITIVGVSFLSSESPFCPRTYARRGDEGPGRSTTAAARITTRLVSRVSMYAYVCTITKSASLCFCRSRPFLGKGSCFFWFRFFSPPSFFVDRGENNWISLLCLPVCAAHSPVHTPQATPTGRKGLDHLSHPSLSRPAISSLTHHSLGDSPA